MTLYYNILARKLGLAKASDWGIAIRSVNSFQTIIGHGCDESSPFRIINNTKDYWFADPLLFSEHESTFLFVEAYSYERHKGELGVFDIINGEAKNFRKIIETSTHMSYPFVFKWNDAYYMIPETGAAKEIVLYKAASFPDDWDVDKVLLSGGVYRDHTIYQDDDNILKMISYRQEGSNRFNLKYFVDLFELDMNKKELTLITEKCDKEKINRPAGPILNIDGHKYRLTQRCNRAYGESIYVFDMNNGLDIRRSQIINELRGQHINISDGSKPILLHTYSQAGGYEVIDYRCRL